MRGDGSRGEGRSVDMQGGVDMTGLGRETERGAEKGSGGGRREIMRVIFMVEMFGSSLVLHNL